MGNLTGISLFCFLPGALRQTCFSSSPFAGRQLIFFLSSPSLCGPPLAARAFFLPVRVSLMVSLFVPAVPDPDKKIAAFCPAVSFPLPRFFFSSVNLLYLFEAFYRALPSHADSDDRVSQLPSPRIFYV